MAGPAAPTPKSLLGRHRLLAPTASVRVSPISLGGMSLGTNWAAMMNNPTTKEGVFELLDTYYDLGGNFIDTANIYQGQQSEQWIGDWMKKTGKRSELVISTKYGLNHMMGHPVQQSNFGGTGTKSMHVAIQQSLENLKTDYIDLYFVHVWDFATGVEELMQSLNALVAQGKVLYLGVSDTPAWLVVKANDYARQHGLRPFSVYQGRYSALIRDMEREIFPMCRDQGMAVHSWGVMGNGHLVSPDAPPKKVAPGASFILTGREKSVSAVVDKVAKRHGVPLNSVALAYAMQKTPYLVPIIGGTSISQLKANAEALSLRLTLEDMAEIDAGYEFDMGFPNNFITLPGSAASAPQDSNILPRLGYFDYVAAPSAIKPHQGAIDAHWAP